LTEIVVDTDVKNRLRSGALKRRLGTLSKGTVILKIRDPDITTIGCVNLAPERARYKAGDINLVAESGREAPFFNCKSLLRVYLKGCTKLTSVGTAAFWNCSSLTSVVLPDSLTQLGDDVFDGCTSLTSVVLPDSLTHMGMGAFSKCSSLTSVVFPGSLTELGDTAFARCSSLTSVVFPNSLTVLGDAAFGLCTSLTSVVLPDSAELGNGVFYECNALEQKADLAGFDSVELYLRDRYKRITLRKLVLRLLGKYNQAVNNADGTEEEKHASALAQFPADNSGSLNIGLFLQKMNISGGDGEKGLVGYILEFV